MRVLLFSVLLVAVCCAGSASAALFGVNATAVGTYVVAYNGGSASPVGTTLVSKFGLAQQLSAADASTGVIYDLGFNFNTSKCEILGFSTSSGQVTATLPVPFLAAEFVGVGQSIDWSAKSKQLILTGGLTTSEDTRTVLAMDATGASKTVGTITGDLVDVLDGASAFADNVGRLYVQIGQKNATTGNVEINLFVVDVNTGAVSVVKQNYEIGHGFDTMGYDAATGTIVGIGVKPAAGVVDPAPLAPPKMLPKSETGGRDVVARPVRKESAQYVRCLVQLEPNTNTWVVGPAITDFYGEDGNMIAIENGLVYSFLAPSNPPPVPIYHLVAVNTTTGAVQSSPASCNVDECPWSLASV